MKRHNLRAQTARQKAQDNLDEKEYTGQSSKYKNKKSRKFLSENHAVEECTHPSEKSTSLTENTPSFSKAHSESSLSSSFKASLEQESEKEVATHSHPIQTSKASKKAVRVAQKAKKASSLQMEASRLQFSDEERSPAHLEPSTPSPIPSDSRSDNSQNVIETVSAKKKQRQKLYTLRRAIPTVRAKDAREPTHVSATAKKNPAPLLRRPAQATNTVFHSKMHDLEEDNAAVEGAHRSEEWSESAIRHSLRKVQQERRFRKLQPHRRTSEAIHTDRLTFTANRNVFHQRSASYAPASLLNNGSSLRVHSTQKRQIIREYAKQARSSALEAGHSIPRTFHSGSVNATQKIKRLFVHASRHPGSIALAVVMSLLLILFIIGLTSSTSLVSGAMNEILGTSYTSEDSDLVAVENAYAAMENALQGEIDSIEQTHPGYDEYQYDLDTIGHDPHELASYLTAVLQSYTLESAQTELQRVFDRQYTLTLTEDIQERTYTDENGNEQHYEYRILHVTLTNTPISTFAADLLNDEQLEMFHVYLETRGNKPLVFGGGTIYDGSSESLGGVQFINGTRPGNTEVISIALAQVGNVGGYPYWYWYGFPSRVEWCACFVSWCYGQVGLSEPRFAGCQSQGVPWFQSRGQWGARGYENIAPGDAIFFDWNLDGVADHVGLVIGSDGSSVYTVEGNSGDACKVRSYPLDYQCIKGYGLMNW